MITMTSTMKWFVSITPRHASERPERTIRNIFIQPVVGVPTVDITIVFSVAERKVVQYREEEEESGQDSHVCSRNHLLLMFVCI